MLRTPAIIYCAVDTLIPSRGKMQPGFDEFSAALEHSNIPVVWVTARTRLQMDDPRRRLGHNHPFIAEGGCGVYLPEGYFNVRPTKTMRLGRFTAIPVAEPQPAASELLEEVSSSAGVGVVPLRTLSPRELAQNSGLPAKEAELARQRDFDELFFFAGASEHDIERFASECRERKVELRPRSALWSLAAGANLKECIHELSRLYQRVLRFRSASVGIATSEDDGYRELLGVCDRSVLLSRSDDSGSEPIPRAQKMVSLANPDMWEQTLELVMSRG